MSHCDHSRSAKRSTTKKICLLTTENKGLLNSFVGKIQAFELGWTVEVVQYPPMPRGEWVPLARRLALT